MRSKRVTPAKLIAASKALIALSECEDWTELTLAHWERRLNSGVRLLHEADIMPLNQLQLAIMANEISGMLERFES